MYHGDEIPQAEQETQRMRARALASAATGGGASTGALITDVAEVEPEAVVPGPEPIGGPTAPADEGGEA